jgi:hypothetical protein
MFFSPHARRVTILYRGETIEKSMSRQKATARPGRACRSLPVSCRTPAAELATDLFPTGMPAREQVIRAVSGWLDDAERLARMR